MAISPRTRSVVTFAAALLALQWTLTAQSPVTAKKPLTYDVVDSWKSIQGTRLSDDGQWLTYSTTAPGDDGDVFVRNLRTGQEFKQARGTNPSFTLDARFVAFTIAQPKADEERDAQANAGGGGEAPGTEASPGRGRGNNARREPRTGFGIMSLDGATMGQVKTFDKVGSFAMPDKSSTWVAYYRGVGGSAVAARPRTPQQGPRARSARIPVRI
jgi:hypothetical protein